MPMLQWKSLQRFKVPVFSSRVSGFKVIMDFFLIQSRLNFRNPEIALSLLLMQNDF